MTGRLNSPAQSQHVSLEKITSSTEESQTIYELSQALNGRNSLSEAWATIAEKVRRLVPTSVFVLFVYDSQQDELRVRYAYGEHADSITGTRIPMGKRLTGWVAANNQTVVNSDPALDLGDAARSLEPRLRSCLATPLRLPDDDLIGVLTLYSNSNLRNAFTDDHRRVVEMVADQVALTIQRSSTAKTDVVPFARNTELGLSTVEDLQRLFGGELEPQSCERCYSVLLIVVRSEGASVNDEGGSAFERASTDLTEEIRSSLGSSALLCQAGPDEVLALLPSTDSENALHLRSQLQTTLPPWPSVGIGYATSPVDGTNLDDLQRTARARVNQNQLRSDRRSGPRPSVH